MARNANGVYLPDFLPPENLPWQQGMNPDQQVNIAPAANAFKDRFMGGADKGLGPAAPDHAMPETEGPMGHGREGLPEPIMPAHAMGGMADAVGGAAKSGLKNLAGAGAKMASL